MKPIYWPVWFAFFFLSGCSNPPSIDFQDLKVFSLEGEPVDLSQYAGKRIFLNFWATWCGPCLRELPSMQAALSQLESENYVFLLLSNEPAATLSAFRDQNSSLGFQFYQLSGSMKLLGIFSIPQTYLIDREGNIAYSFSGPRDWSAPKSMKLLREVK